MAAVDRGGSCSWASALIAPMAALAQSSGASGDDTGGVDADNASDGYTPAEGSTSAVGLSVNGYVDVGFARAQGDGTSFAAGDTRLPADYGVDTFAPAVNSRGDVASTDPGRALRERLSPAVGRASAASRRSCSTPPTSICATAPPSLPLMFFSRAAALAALRPARATRPRVAAAAGVRPDGARSSSQELALSRRQVRLGVRHRVPGERSQHPHRHHAVADRALHDRPVAGRARCSTACRSPRLWSAVSLNVAATNSGSFVESLQTPDASPDRRAGRQRAPRLRAEPAALQLKLGVSGVVRPAQRSDDRAACRSGCVGGDLRIAVAALYLNGEYVRVDEAEGRDREAHQPGRVPAGLGFPRARLLRAARLRRCAARRRAAAQAHRLRPLRTAHARFQGFTPLLVDRITGGAARRSVGVGDREGRSTDQPRAAGAPDVANNVITSSVVYSF